MMVPSSSYLFGLRPLNEKATKVVEANPKYHYVENRENKNENEKEEEKKKALCFKLGELCSNNRLDTSTPLVRLFARLG